MSGGVGRPGSTLIAGNSRGATAPQAFHSPVAMASLQGRTSAAGLTSSKVVMALLVVPPPCASPSLATGLRVGPLYT